MGAKEVTVTDARFKQSLRNGVNNVVQNTVPQMINKAVNESKIRTGVVSKFYPWLDNAEVDLDNVNKKVLCKLPHRFVGSLIEFYIPSGDNSYCEKLHEPCIIPKEPLHCIVINIHDEDSDDYLLLSYFLPDEIVGFAPPHQGNMKITTFLPSAENYIEFGGAGLKVVSKTPVDANYGEYEDDITKLEYMTSDDVSLWTSTTLNEYATLYVNEAIHLCELKYTRSFSRATEYTEYNWGTALIPRDYRPSEDSYGSMNNGGTIFITSEGNLKGYFDRTMETRFTAKGSVLWHY